MLAQFSSRFVSSNLLSILLWFGFGAGVCFGLVCIDVWILKFFIWFWVLSTKFVRAKSFRTKCCRFRFGLVSVQDFEQVCFAFCFVSCFAGCFSSCFASCVARRSRFASFFASLFGKQICKLFCKLLCKLFCKLLCKLFRKLLRRAFCKMLSDFFCKLLCTARTAQTIQIPGQARHFLRELSAVDLSVCHQGAGYLGKLDVSFRNFPA